MSAPSSEAQPRIDDLPALDVEARSARVRAFLETQGLDALAVTTLTNVRWLTGFTGSNGAALITDAELVLITDGGGMRPFMTPAAGLLGDDPAALVWAAGPAVGGYSGFNGSYVGVVLRVLPQTGDPGAERPTHVALGWKPSPTAAVAAEEEAAAEAGQCRGGMTFAVFPLL